MVQSTTIKGPSDDSSIPKKSLGKILYEELKRKNSDKIILKNEETSEILTSKQLLEHCVHLAKYMKKLGLKKNDIITIISPNNWQFMVSVIAGFFIGVSVNALNPDYTIGELRHFFSQFCPKLVFSCGKSNANVLKLKEEFQIDYLVNFDNDPTEGSDNFSDILKTSNNTENRDFIVDEVDVEEVALIYTSSGTTGMPKAVALTHRNIRTCLLYTRHPLFVDFNDNQSTIGYLPFFHIFGSIIALASIYHGTHLTILSKFVPDVFLSVIQKQQVSLLFTVPPILLFLVKSPLVSKYDLSSVKELICGGAAVSKDLQSEVKKRIGITSIRQLYGLTETAGAVLITPKDSEKFGSAGVPTISVEIKICDAQDNILNCGEIGEIRVKGDNIMKGYVNNVKETEKSFDKNGFLRTGDLGYFDEDGLFYIVDRLKEIIKYKGFQVSPAELEYIILKHPDVKDVGVIGKPDEKAGELPVAFVVKQPHVNIQEEEIVKFVDENVSLQKRLYGGVRFVEEIPKNPSGKILRRKLKEML